MKVSMETFKYAIKGNIKHTHLHSLKTSLDGKTVDNIMPVKMRYNKLPREEPTSSLQEEQIGIWSLLFYHWMTDTFKTGNSRPLQQSDLLPIEEQNKTRILTENLQNIWLKERNACFGSGKRPRLWRCVARILPLREIMIIVLFGMVESISAILRCLLLGVILSNLTSSKGDKTVMYVSAVLMVVVIIGERIFTTFRNWMAEVMGQRICCALRGMIYSKICLVGHHTLQEFREGHVIDLISNDIQRMELLPMWFFDIIISTFYIPIAFCLLITLFHWEAITGGLFLLSLAAFFLLASYLVGKLRRQTAQISDKRITVMNELVSGIRAVKTQAWEDRYDESIKEIRRQEISKIRLKSVVLSTVEAFVSSSSSIAAFLTIVSLVMSHWGMNPADAFMLLSLMKQMKVYGSLYLGRGLPLLSEATVSFNRIEEFLILDELPVVSSDGFNVSDSLLEGKTTLSRNEQHSAASPPKRKDLLQSSIYRNDNRKLTNSLAEGREQMISRKTNDSLDVCNATFKVNKEGEKDILFDVCFETPRNSLTVVCGRVGSGKSTLLSAIAGEVNLTKGTVHYPGTLAYVTQVPWLFSGTIKENILFNEPYDPKWYSTVVEACALKKDIELFPSKHDTLVGQRGIVLSGGQKARVSLARAVYSCADVYLLDDPLSAVDQKVGDEIFRKCICGLLGDKIRVLVCHHRRYLQAADEIVIMDNGQVVEKSKPQKCEDDFGESIVLNTSSGGYLPELQPQTEKSSDKAMGLDIPDEDRAVGGVSFRLYWNYFTSGIHPILFVSLIALFLLTQPIAGLSLSYVMETLDVVQYAIRQFSEVENIMTSVERVITYTKLESEPGYKTKTLPLTYWPCDGQVTFRNVTLSYYEHGPQVLRDLNFVIHGNSRVGVVGRTGAGKSSLVAAFLRMPDVQGDVIIDGVKITDINLKESRRCISVLSQVPVIFSGSLRRNLDPMNQHEDLRLWSALEVVQLKSVVESLDGQLEYDLLESGANLSVGERQLVCLARTLLQDNRIVILDEPTAHVDPITEQTIWKTVHEKLNNCTVITIAHRLDTIKSCDTILVMREGEIAEFGTFDSLMGRDSGLLPIIAQTISQ
ncbi:PREDICTED: multidrug resistance-associated protein 4-like [Acropora digitifera]|uniref:multidrug resistance-associated protein 4-like n=1 Tax=Acropora digitifera TaxID=70779 RepID=UPI00077A21EF|nr:PREDICTED: multidrug resistance-associated protein 4-like [Acropora digitifera]